MPIACVCVCVCDLSLRKLHSCWRKLVFLLVLEIVATTSERCFVEDVWKSVVHVHPHVSEKCLILKLEYGMACIMSFCIVVEFRIMRACSFRRHWLSRPRSDVIQEFKRRFLITSLGSPKSIVFHNRISHPFMMWEKLLLSFVLSFFVSFYFSLLFDLRLQKAHRCARKLCISSCSLT